jgi:riboflavin kinase/FMN adenylyltransferase
MRVIRHPRPAAGDCAIAIGKFDGLHRGHLAMIARLKREAAARGLAPAVLTFEPLPPELFSPRDAPPRLMAAAEKLALLEREGVATTYLQRFDLIFAALSPREFAVRLRERLGARWVIVGAEFRFGARRSGDPGTLASLGRELGFEVEVLGNVLEQGERISSGRVRDCLAAGDFPGAARLLGRPYAICGRVVRGAQRGRTLGFPTANVRLARAKPPVKGVFAVRCDGAATRGLEGVASLGYNPAVRTGGPASLEAYLFDFQGDLYGRRISIEFLKKLRDEAHFASLDELAAQIRRDCDAAREYFRAQHRGATR